MFQSTTLSLNIPSRLGLEDQRIWEKSWYFLGRAAVEAAAPLLFRMDIARQAAIPAGAKILAANHPSTIDPVMLTTLVPEQVGILISETLFKVPGLGRSLRMAGHIPVEEGRGQACLESGVRYLQAGRTVGIFPEGAISPLEGGLHRAHTGVARLALAAGVPVIPIGFALERQNLRLVETVVDGRRETGTWYLHGAYAITVGEPMRLKGNLEGRAQVRAAAGQVMERIAQLSRESALRLETARRRNTAGRWQSPAQDEALA
ncbi:MAG: 1-acyl-sn-glycerol-3-phosphate acyltransferase [Chloroflexi bacterium]|nr:1-acyl-sn-glycerol-3-phosphate acyltransferase [Chloroflexota bacterium]